MRNLTSPPEGGHYVRGVGRDTVAAAIVVAVVAGGAALLLTAPLAAQTPGQRVFAQPVMPFGSGSAIGVQVRDLTAEEAKAAKLPAPGGVFVDRVDEGSPAQKAGLKSADVIVEFDAERVRGARHFSRLVEETPGGRAAKTVVMRNGARHTLDVTPEERRLADVVRPEIERGVRERLRALPRDFAFDFDLEGPDMGVMVAPRGRLGVQVTPLTDQLGAFFGARDGLLVSSVEPDSPAAKAGLKAGDVITSVDGRAVGDTDALIRMTMEAKPGAVLEVGIVRDRKASSVKATMPEPPVRRTLRRARPV